MSDGHITNLLIHEMKNCGRSLRDLANDLPMGRAAVSMFCRREMNIRYKSIEALCDLFNLGFDGQGEHGFTEFIRHGLNALPDDTIAEMTQDTGLAAHTFQPFVRVDWVGNELEGLIVPYTNIDFDFFAEVLGIELKPLASSDA